MNAYLWHGQPSENVAFDLLVMGLLNNTALIHLELFESADGNTAFHRLMQYIKISSFRSSWHGRQRCGRSLNEQNNYSTPLPSSSRGVGGGVHYDVADDQSNESSRRTENSGSMVEDEQDNGEEPPPSSSSSSSSSFHRIMHRMINHLVQDMILNATYVKWNVMIGGAAAA